MSDMNDVLGVVLGGGQGSRLYPLTKLRAKPAVPIAGKYRLIDIPMSNCINSGIHRIAVLTQFNSVSLHRHISQTYVFDSFSRGWVQILAAEQTPASSDWYQGNADAVRKQLLEIQAAETSLTVILAGDHLYRMDYEKLAKFHWDAMADITVAVQPVNSEDASRFGLVMVDKDKQIIGFAEKPKNADLLKKFKSREDPIKPYLGSMGIYMFNTNILVEILNKTTATDFGGEIIPAVIKSHNVYAFDFNGYWQDIGTIQSFYDINLSLSNKKSPFNFHDSDHPIYSRPRFLPGSTISGADLENVLMADGCQLGDSTIKDSVIGLRSQVFDGVQIISTYVMGADYFDTKNSIEFAGGIPIGIGKGSVIQGAIIDKNVRIGENVTILPFPRNVEIDESEWSVRDGIVIIPKDTVLPSGTTIAP